MEYDPEDETAGGTRVVVSSPISFNYLISNFDVTGGQPGVTTYTLVGFDPSEDENVTQITSEAFAGPIILLAKTKNGQNCGIFRNVLAETIEVYNFDEDQAEVSKFADITDLYASLNGQNSSTIGVADDCLAIHIDENVFHWNAEANPPAYEADTLPDPLWTAPMFDKQFKTAVTETAIY